MDGRYDMVVESEQDWAEFGKENLDTIVDPMIFRTADVYLRGRRGTEQAFGADHSRELWAAISSNIDSLISFFDAVILSKRLPMIDYGITFDSDPAIDAHNLYQKCNQDPNDKIVFYVHVMGPAHAQAREAALAELAKKPGELPYNLANSVLQELSAFDYRWQPNLGPLESQVADNKSLVLKRFMYGFMLFSAFAQITGAQHLIQGKRSRLYAAMSLGASSANDVDALDREVSQVFEQAGYPPQDIQDLPTFLPYLLAQNPRNPADLLRRAVELRHDSDVQAYRKWRAEITREYRDYGRFKQDDQATVRQLQEKIRRQFADQKESLADAKISLKFTTIPPFVSPEGQVEASAVQITQRLWGWIMEQLPGRRYTKVLTRMAIAAQEYQKIDRALLTLWKQA